MYGGGMCHIIATPKTIEHGFNIFLVGLVQMVWLLSFFLGFLCYASVYLTKETNLLQGN